MRPGSDDRHIAAQHVEDLRQLIERTAPQPAPDPRHPGVAAGNLEPGIVIGEMVMHGTKFQHLEVAVVEAGPPLAEQHRPWTVQPDCQRDA